MKKDEIKKAYEELNFSEDLQNRYLQAAALRKDEKKRGKIRLAPVLLCILLLGTTIYAAERFDWFNWYYKNNYPLIRDSTDINIYSTQNEHLKMSVENAVFTKEYGIVFLHIEALDEKGKAFMQQNKESLSIELTAENDAEANTGGSCSANRLCREVSDEENWYYTLQTINHKTSSSADYETARVIFPSPYPGGEGDVQGNFQAMELAFPVIKTIGDVRVYKECEGFEELSVSPLTVTIVWRDEESIFSRYVQRVDITMKDGSVIGYQNQSGEALSPEWDSCLYSNDDKDRNILTLIPKEILDVENIASVSVNGVVCK